jgi:hypothetical protein
MTPSAMRAHNCSMRARILVMREENISGELTRTAKFALGATK